MFGEILGAIGSFFSADRARKSANQLRDDTNLFNRTKIQTTVKDARAAGIHPLAALGSPVAGSWASPVAPYAGDAIGEGISRIGDAVTKGAGNELVQLQKDAERARIANLNANTAVTLADAESRTTLARARAAGQSMDTADLVARGRPILTDRGFSDAQKFENRYGELSDFIFGPLIAEADLMKNTGMTVGQYGLREADRVADSVRGQVDGFVNNQVDRGIRAAIDWFQKQRGNTGYSRR